MVKLANKVTIVTGAGSGIGQAIALLFASEGALVYAADINETGLKQTQGEAPYGADVRAATLDVTDEDAVSALWSRVSEQEGRIDIVVNNAGIGVAATVDQTSVEDWERMMAINVRGTFLGCKHAVRLMKPRGEGNIINMASVAGLVGVRNRAGYCASKGAVVALTRAIAVDHAGDGIRVNCICPGTVESPWIGRILSDHPDPEEGRRTMAARQPIGRMGTPQEIAHAALYLAQPESAYVHGSALVIDGGLTAM